MALVGALDLDISKGSPKRFGYSWERFSELTAEQERQFQLWTTPIDPAVGWKGVRFLDAGCGAGRNSYWAMTYGADSACAFDLDQRSLDAARSNLSEFPQAKVREGDIYNIPYQDEFDIVFSIGVIHHLAHPKDAIAQLVKAAKPGGTILVWVYGYENLEIFVNVLNPLRKALFSWMPLALVRTLAHAPTAILWGLLHIGFTPIKYLKLLKEFPYHHLHHIVFDQMIPQTANYWRQDEARSLLDRPDVHSVQVDWINECSWTVSGKKRT